MDSDGEDERAALNADITAVTTSALEEMKLVLVVNDSLKMTKGKIGAQCGHATLACYKTLMEYNPKVRHCGSFISPSYLAGGRWRFLICKRRSQSELIPIQLVRRWERQG